MTTPSVEPMRSRQSYADDQAAALLARLGIKQPVATGADHPALAWRRTGLMAVSGRPDGPALMSPIALTEAADGALAALRSIAPGATLPASGAALLGERARLLGLTRQGATSANGSCHLVAARDGAFAINLARHDDWILLPALFECEAGTLADVRRLSAAVPLARLIARGRLLGLAIAADTVPPPVSEPFAIEQLGPSRATARRPLVVDFSALWAGPLASSLLRDCGADVVKIESCARPDGARYGNAPMFDLLNAGKRSVALDFGDVQDLAALQALVRRADIIVEASRPRALRALGIDARSEAARGAVWVSITGHGRTGPAADWIGFGDDAAVAGGLSAAMRRGWGQPLFAGDAIADPLTGITAALAAWASWRAGGGRLISLALSNVIAHAASLSPAGDELRSWQALAETDTSPLYPLRSPVGAAAVLGADTAAVLG